VGRIDIDRRTTTHVVFVRQGQTSRGAEGLFEGRESMEPTEQGLDGIRADAAKLRVFFERIGITGTESGVRFVASNLHQAQVSILELMRAADIDTRTKSPTSSGAFDEVDAGTDTGQPVFERGIEHRHPDGERWCDATARAWRELRPMLRRLPKVRTQRGETVQVLVLVTSDAIIKGLVCKLRYHWRFGADIAELMRLPSIVLHSRRSRFSMWDWGQI
jgi:broad specificity phosphatase PhoE